MRHLVIKTAVLLAVKHFSATADYNGTTHELALQLSETNETPSACDLVVTRVEYFSELKTLNIDLKPDFCQVDNYGIRQGHLKWQVPVPLRNEGALILHVNGEVIGTVQLSPNGAVVTRD